MREWQAWIDFERLTRVRQTKQRKGFPMILTTISTKFQIVIPKEVRDKLHLRPRQRLHVLEKGGVIILLPEVPLKLLKGALKDMSPTELREK